MQQDYLVQGSSVVQQSHSQDKEKGMSALPGMYSLQIKNWIFILLAEF